MNPLVIVLIILGSIAVIVGALYAAGIIGGSPAPPPSEGLAPSPSPGPAPPPRVPGAYSGPSYASTQTPVNCQVSSWSDSGNCSVTLCGATGGTKTQTRTITTPAANGGTACPALTQTVPCNGPTCVTCTGGMELNRATNTCLLSQQQIATNLQQTYGINVPVFVPNAPPPPAVQQALQVQQAQQAAVQAAEARSTDWTPGTGCNPSTYGYGWGAYGGKTSYCVYVPNDPCCGTTSQSTTQVMKHMGEECNSNDECDTGYCAGVCMS